MNIKELREKTGLSCPAFSEKYEIPIGTLRHWEAGEREAPDYVIEMLTKLIGLEDLRVKGYIFNEYRDARGAGTETVFKTEEEALEYAQQEWDHMNEKDQASYLGDNRTGHAEFYVALVDMIWDDIAEKWVTDPEGECQVIKDWLF